MTKDVYLKSGEQPRAFSWGPATAPVYSTTGTLPSRAMYKESPWSTFQAIVEGTGAVTATVLIEGSNDDETGRGVVLANTSVPGVPGALVQTTASSATMTSEAKQFSANLVGTVVEAEGVTAGTTVTAVAAGGGSLTLSAAATATSPSSGVQANFVKTNWCKTVLGTITLTATTKDTDGVFVLGPWRYVRMRVSAISGTGAAVRGFMGV